MRKQFTVSIEYTPYEEAIDPITREEIENIITDFMEQLDENYEIDAVISVEVSEL